MHITIHGSNSDVTGGSRLKIIICIAQGTLVYMHIRIYKNALKIELLSFE